MRLATWNVNSVKARLPRLLDWLADDQARRGLPAGDQVRRTAPSRPPRSASWATPSPATATAGGTASRCSPGSGSTTSGRASPASPASPSPEARAIAATCGGVRVWSVYVPNGRTPDDPHYAYKLAWLAALRDALAAELAGGLPLAVCGDFNVAPTDADVWDPALFVGSTHVTPAERAALAALRDLGLQRRRAHADEGPAPLHLLGLPGRHVPPEQGHADRPGVRHAAFADRVRSAYVDREARKGKGPSDHAPIVVDAGPGPGGRVALRVLGWGHGSREDQRNRGPRRRRRGAGEAVRRAGGAVENSPGFLGFELLRPVAGENRYFVYTQWESEEAYEAWPDGPSRAAHAAAPGRKPRPPGRDRRQPSGVRGGPARPAALGGTPRA